MDTIEEVLDTCTRELGEGVFEILDMHEETFDDLYSQTNNHTHKPFDPTSQTDNPLQDLPHSHNVNSVTAAILLPPIVSINARPINKPRPKTAHATSANTIVSSHDVKSPLSPSTRLRPVSAVHIKHTHTQMHTPATSNHTTTVITPHTHTHSPITPTTPTSHLHTHLHTLKHTKSRSSCHNRSRIHTNVHILSSHSPSSSSHTRIRPLSTSPHKHTRTHSKSPHRILKYSPLPVSRPIHRISPRIQHLLEDIRKAYENRHVMRPFSSSVFRRPMSPLTSDKYKKKRERDVLFDR